MCSRLPDRETEAPRELSVFIIGSWMEVGAGKLLNTVEQGSWLLPINKEVFTSSRLHCLDLLLLLIMDAHVTAIYES